MDEAATQTYGVVRIGEIVIAIRIEHLSEVFHSNEELKLPIISDLLQGGVDLRGKLIPVLDLSIIGRFERCDRQGRLGVVVESNSLLLAFYVDEIVGIARQPVDEVYEIADNCLSGRSFFKSHFSFNNTYVTIMDVSEVFAVPGIFSVAGSENARSQKDNKGAPMLTFSAGDALYSIPAVEVHAAVPKQTIRKTAITSGPCLGEITYHSRRIPVVCPTTILGLGRKQDRSTSEVVVLRFPEDLLLGIAVDSIRDIQAFSVANEAKLPVLQNGSNLIEKALILNDGVQIYSINVELLFQTESVAEFAKLSREEAVNGKTQNPKKKDVEKRNIIKERESYLIVDLHKRVAIPLLQVTCIQDQPRNWTPAEGREGGFLGYFSRLGRSVALIDLRKKLGVGQVDWRKAQVLLTEYDETFFGYLVDQVVGIEVSQWRQKSAYPKRLAEETVVQLGTGENAQVLPFFDLSKMDEVRFENVAEPT